MKTRQFHSIESSGVRLRVLVEGEGPLVVLVHGWPESWYSYRHQLEPLKTAGFRIAALDMRGFGGSDKPHEIEAYSMARLSADVAAVIDALGGGPAILIGHDWGALVVWATAILYRSRVSAVVGLSVPFLGRTPRPLLDVYRKVYADRFFYQLYFQEPGLAERELDADVALTLRKAYFSTSGDASPEEATRIMNKPKDAKFLDGMTDPSPLPAWLSAEDIDYCAEQFRPHGFRSSLGPYRNIERDWAELPQLGTEKIAQPALFLAGDRDPALYFMPGRSMFDVLDAFYLNLQKKVLFKGIGHWVQQEAPDAVNSELLGFLARL
jgi:pimeloyl-ACP methyl ester carboxylesterase